jgi:hypothetical protein
MPLMMHKMSSSIAFTSIRLLGRMRRQLETPTTWGWVPGDSGGRISYLTAGRKRRHRRW